MTITLQQMFADTWDLWPTLKEYAEGRSVLELGVKHGGSSRAFLEAPVLRLISVDSHWQPGVMLELRELALAKGIPFEGFQCDSLSREFLFRHILFIDTSHTYRQVAAELALHAPNTQTHILLHDTDVFGKKGEDKGEGIQKAIDEFLWRNPYDWELEKNVDIWPGLTVLRRVRK